jgi:hypothetical protein
MERAGTIGGRVVLPSSTLPSKLYVGARDGGEERGRSRMLADGRFRIEAVRPGRVQVEVFETDWKKPVLSRSVDVRAGEVVDLAVFDANPAAPAPR